METKRLIETENSIQEFTVQFYGGTVMIEQNQLPLGQISCELLDHPVEELLALHDEAVRLFSIVRDSLFARDKEKSPALAAAVQCQLNRALKHVYPLPLFSLLNIDRDTYGTMLEELCRSAPEEFQKAVTPGTPENEALSSFFGKLFRLPDELLCFQSYVSTMLDFYFEPLRRRNAEHYAVGVYRFFSDAAAQEALRAALPPYPTFEFLQSRPAMTEYVTMPDPVQSEKYILAERVVFSSSGRFSPHGSLPRPDARKCSAPLPQLQEVLPAAERIRCAVLHPDRAGRNEAYLQAGRRAQQAGGPGQQDAGADRIRKHLQPFEKEEGTREDFNR